MEKMQEILSNEGGTPVFNTYAVEIGSQLWDAIYEYMWANQRDLDMCIDGIYEEGSQKFAILRSRKDLTYYRLDFSLTEENGFVPGAELIKVSPEFKPSEKSQFSLEDVEAYEVQFKKNKEDKEKEKGNTEDKGSDKEADDKSKETAPATKDEDSKESEPAKDEDKKSAPPAKEDEKKSEPKDKEEDKDAEKKSASESEDDEEKKKKKAKYSLDEVVEYQELLTKYNALENTNKELQDTISALTAEKVELVKFKNSIERTKKEDLIKTTFYMLSEEQKKDCVDNIDKYSYDEIEAKLSVICVRNKVNFNYEENKQEEKPTTYNLDEVVNDAYDIPDWIKRVNEVRKEKNL